MGKMRLGHGAWRMVNWKLEICPGIAPPCRSQRQGWLRSALQIQKYRHRMSCKTTTKTGHTVGAENFQPLRKIFSPYDPQ